MQYGIISRMRRDVIEKPLLESLNSEVHVWFCRPEAVQDESRLSSYRSLLSVQEKEKLGRFRFPNDRRNYLLSHVMLRKALSNYVAVGAAEFQFDHNAHGKPALRHHVELPAIEFNLTHTDGLCACVITLGGACGIDAENIHRKNDLAAVAQRMFSDEELKGLSVSEGQVDEDMGDQFYDFWTLRESYVKALGTGLSGSSKDFYFTIADDATADIDAQAEASAKQASLYHKSESGSENEKSVDWSFRLFSPTRQHRMAVAYASVRQLQVVIDEVTL